MGNYLKQQANQRQQRPQGLVRKFLFVSIFAIAGQANAANISGVWVNEGGDKVTQGELRATLKQENLTGSVLNKAWNGKTVSLFGARNEVVSFNLVIEAAKAKASNVTVTFDSLNGPNGDTIRSAPASGNGVFDWTARNIELFYARYLQIKGLSFFGYGKWDERQVPRRFQRPWAGNGHGWGSWNDRPDHDKFYPDALVPLELVRQFDIEAGKNQSIWADIYIPKSVSPGLYRGVLNVRENGTAARAVPVQLTVANFALPDTPTVRTMGQLDTTEIMWRYVTNWGGYTGMYSGGGARVREITDKYYQLFHRHKIMLIGENECVADDRPCDSSIPRLDGSLYTASRGYRGPGENTPEGIFSIGTYGTWNWRHGATQTSMWRHTNNWANWFKSNLPGTEYFLYLQDEPPPSDVPQVETWAQWVKSNPGPGRNLMTMSTYGATLARKDMPSVSIPATGASVGGCDHTVLCDVSQVTQNAADYYSQLGRRMWMYNDSRPGTGSSNTEDDGVAMRQIAWAQYKKNVNRWFYWYVNVNSQINPFTQSITWGSAQFKDSVLGLYGDDGTTNGTGLLVYPGTNLYQPEDSYDVDGPLASLRLKEWRRGVQDTDYLALAKKVDPEAANRIMQKMVPQALWEYGAIDPNYYVGGISWSTDPDSWENARAELTKVISNYCDSHKEGFCQ